MWRDQANYFAGQFIKSHFLNWFCAKMSFANTQQPQCILNRNWSEPIFISDFVFCHSVGRLDSFFFFFIVHQPNSVTTVLLHFGSESSFWRNHCIERDGFLLLFSFSLWSSTAPCCLKNISTCIKDCILRSFNLWLNARCAIACFIL